MSVARDIFLCGYFRELTKILNQSVPTDIRSIIIKYQKIGTIFGIGCNYDGQIGLPEAISKRETFTELHEFEKLGMNEFNVYPNYESMMTITPENELYVSGNNTQDKLGVHVEATYKDNIHDRHNTYHVNCVYGPKQALFAEPIKFASCGLYNRWHTFIYTVNNRLYASGTNHKGQLGIKQGFKDCDEYFRFQYVENTSFSEFALTAIVCGEDQSFFLTDQGCVYTCGGEMKTYGSKKLPIKSIDPDDEPIIIRQMSAGPDHCLFLDTEQRLITYGSNYTGECNDNKDIRDDYNAAYFHRYFYEHRDEIKINHINAGIGLSLCLDVNGGCYLFGWSDTGQFCDGVRGEQEKYTPERINNHVSNREIVDGCLGAQFIVLLSEKNELITCGDNQSKQCSSAMDVNWILTPHFVSKTQEIGILENSWISKVIAYESSTIVFVDPNKCVNDDK